MQLKEKKSSMERDKRKLESELERQRQTIGKQVFLQVVSKRQSSTGEQSSTSTEQQNIIMNENITSSPKPLQPVTSSPNPSITSPLSVDSSQNFNLLSKEKETSRRQWDKSKKNFDLENETAAAAQQKVDIKVNSAGAASSSSSLSTPSSAASQSPSQTKDNKTSNTNNMALDAMSVDLSKAYYSRDEMIKAIEALKDRYVRESSVVAELSNNNASSPSNLNNNSSNNTSMVKDIETLNSKLSSLQNEINRLTLLQQKQYDQQHNQATSLLSKASNTPNSKNSNSANNSFNLIDDRKAVLSDKEDLPSVKSNTNNISNKNDDVLNNDAFFVSFGTGLAKREKPIALTPKKNLIFIKSKLDYFELFFIHKI
jgi:hypothetical protein